MRAQNAKGEEFEMTGEDLLARAFQRFKQTSTGPMLIIVDSHIAYGAPHAHDTANAGADRST